MCGRARQFATELHSGMKVQFVNKDNILTEGRWGIGTLYNQAATYNARLENLNGTWKNYIGNRGIVQLDGFYEGKNSFFCLPNHTPLNVAVIYDNRDEFLIITQPAQLPVKLVHLRQPLILEDPELWIKERKIVRLKESLIKQVALLKRLLQV